MSARKLTKPEQRAREFCAHVREAGSVGFTIEWRRSRTWGMNPAFPWGDGNAVSVSGCGYCKLSTALAELLQWLGETDEQRHSIAVTAGGGVSTVRAALAGIGWTLEEVASSRTSDSYIIRRAGGSA